MSEFETLIMCLLIPLYGVLFYTVGKADLLNLVVLMIKEKTKEIEERMSEDGK